LAGDTPSGARTIRRRNERLEKQRLRQADAVAQPAQHEPSSGSNGERRNHGGNDGEQENHPAIGYKICQVHAQSPCKEQEGQQAVHQQMSEIDASNEGLERGGVQYIYAVEPNHESDTSNAITMRPMGEGNLKNSALMWPRAAVSVTRLAMISMLAGTHRRAM